MRAFLDCSGTLRITPESGTEAYALDHWFNDFSKTQERGPATAAGEEVPACLPFKPAALQVDTKAYQGGAL